MIGANQCSHDSLSRSCEICERDSEIETLRARVQQAEWQRDKAFAFQKLQTQRIEELEALLRLVEEE